MFDLINSMRSNRRLKVDERTGVNRDNITRKKLRGDEDRPGREPHCRIKKPQNSINSSATIQFIYMTEHRSPSKNLIKSNDEY